jgi:uncharacterized protein YndB with AHSA1/START domain
MLAENPDERARAVYDVASGVALAMVDIRSSPERVFQALTGPDVTQWWVNPGVFDTREWRADPRVGGRWRATGVGRGRPYVLEGEFLAVDAPRRLVHSWRAVGGPTQDSMVTYLLDSLPDRTHVTIRHEGFKAAEPCIRSCLGWETSLQALRRLLSPSP